MSRRPIAVLHIAELQERAGATVMFARSVLAAMRGNARFPSPPIPLATFEAHIDALDAAEVAALLRTKGNAQKRDAKLSVVVADLQVLCVYVQQIADGHAADGPAIITEAGMSVKTVTHHDKPVLEARPRPVSGSVRLYAKAMRNRSFYDWQYSPDGVNYLNLPSTLKASTDITGLVLGTAYWFRVRRSTKAGTGDWSDPVRLIVT
jgi:hypothetical protein